MTLIGRIMGGVKIPEREKWERKRYTVYKNWGGDYSVRSDYLPRADVEWGIDEIHSLEEADAMAIRRLREMAQTILWETEEREAQE